MGKKSKKTKLSNTNLINELKREESEGPKYISGELLEQFEDEDGYLQVLLCDGDEPFENSSCAVEIKPGEEWRSVSEFKGKYIISSLGRVMRVRNSNTVGGLVS